jgi:DNA repair protein RecO (recombination protein O)
MRGVAKGAKRSRRRFGANLDLLAHVRIHGFERPNRDLVRIEGADLLDYYEGIRQDLLAFARACYLAEWTEGCTAEREPLPGLFPLLLQVLTLFEEKTGGEELLRIFEMKLLNLAGYGPRLGRCVSCERSLNRVKKVSIHTARGGALCGNCSVDATRGIPISLGTARILEDAREVTLDRLHRIAFSSKALQESRALLRSFYEYHVGRQLRSTSFLEAVQ